MKTLSATVLAKIAQQYGSEPINIVEVQWNRDGGNFFKYADKEIDLGSEIIPGAIMDISSLESVLKLDSQNVSQSISVQLSDIDNHIKDIFNTIDVHGVLVKVSQWYPDLSINDKFELFQGEMTSPIIWDEGDRSISFDVISKLADKEAGFSPEEGQFYHIPEDLVGVPWPMAFGLVQNVPATRLQEVPETLTAESTVVVDPSLAPKIWDLQQEINFYSQLFNFYAAVAASAAFECHFNGVQEACTALQQYQDFMNQILVRIAELEQEKADLEAELAAQEAEAKSVLQVTDPKNIPQGTLLVLEVEDVELHGVLSGSSFVIHGVVVPDWDGSIDTPYGPTFVQVGSLLKLRSNKSITYVANIMPSDIKYVQAYQNTENGRSLVILPTTWYSVDQVDLGAFIVTAITFSIPISSRDESVEDDIYVTQESSEGPNTVDEMIWLINTFSDLSYDITSFNYVRTMIDNYPSHFAIKERKNLLEMLEEMAWQARCAIWVKDNTVYLKYLSEELTEDGTITEDDIDVGTLQIYGTETEELVTKLVAEWTDNYALEEPHKIILRHNIKKYGTRERNTSFYIYNIGELVLKSATFWLIRMSNVWKNIHFEASLNLLNFETFDTVELDFNTDYVANAPIKSLVTDQKYDSDQRKLIFDVWIPVKFGEMEQYIFSWPSQIDPAEFFPTDQEILDNYAGGGADITGGFTIGDEEIQDNFSVQTSPNTARFQRQDWGDQRPSDLDDVKPHPNFAGTVTPPGTPYDSQYGYKQYDDLVFGTVSEDEESYSYPAKITSGSGITYTCDVYEDGLSATPVSVTDVRQLQILTGVGAVDIPVDTWCLVAKNKTGTDPQSGDDIFEYTMQVPVWL